MVSATADKGHQVKKSPLLCKQEHQSGSNYIQTLTILYKFSSFHSGFIQHNFHLSFLFSLLLFCIMHYNFVSLKAGSFSHF